MKNQASSSLKLMPNSGNKSNRSTCNNKKIWILTMATLKLAGIWTIRLMPTPLVVYSTSMELLGDPASHWLLSFRYSMRSSIQDRELLIETLNGRLSNTLKILKKEVPGDLLCHQSSMIYRGLEEQTGTHASKTSSSF